MRCPRLGVCAMGSMEVDVKAVLGPEKSSLGTMPRWDVFDIHPVSFYNPTIVRDESTAFSREPTGGRVELMDTTAKAFIEHWSWAAEKGVMNKNTAGGLR